MDRVFSIKETSEITKVKYSTLIANVRAGLLSNPVTQDQMYEILSRGWNRYRIRVRKLQKLSEQNGDKMDS